MKITAHQIKADWGNIIGNASVHSDLCNRTSVNMWKNMLQINYPELIDVNLTVQAYWYGMFP